MKAILMFVFLSLGAFSANAEKQSFEDGLRLYELKRFKEAIAVFKPLCEAQNSAKSCFMLALMLERGEGVAKSEVWARTYYDKACSAKLASACLNLGLSYQSAGDANLANVAFYNACSLGHKDACKSLGLIYERRQEGALAAQFYKRACELEDGDSCLLYARLLDAGTLIKYNQKAALQALSRSCELANAKACEILAQNHAKENKDLAKRYYAKACELGQKSACLSYKNLQH